MTRSLVDCEPHNVNAAVLKIDYRSQEWEQRHHFGSMIRAMLHVGQKNFVSAMVHSGRPVPLYQSLCTT